MKKEKSARKSGRYSLARGKTNPLSYKTKAEALIEASSEKKGQSGTTSVSNKVRQLEYFSKALNILFVQ
jgi:hypothetical protein